MSEQNQFVEMGVAHQNASCCSCTYVLNKYKTSLSKILGLVGIVLGLICIGLQIGALVVYSSAWSSLFMQGIWCGIFFVFGGSFALAAGMKNVRGLVLTSLVMNILALLFVMPVIALSELGVDGDDQLTDLSEHETKPEESKHIMVALMVFGALEAIVALVCAVLACLGMRRK